MTTFQSRSAACALAAAISVLLPGFATANGPNEQALEVLKSNPDSMSAVRLLLGNGNPFCTIGMDVDRNVLVDADRTSILYSPAFRAWHGRGAVTRYTEARSSVKALFVAMKSGRCQVVVEKSQNIIALVDALEQDEMRYSILPVPLGPEALSDAFAISLGFSSQAELALATHMMADSEELRAYARLGIKSAAAYDEARARMEAQGYSRDKLQLLSFLADEAEGNRRNLAATAIREERMAKAAAGAN